MASKSDKNENRQQKESVRESAKEISKAKAQEPQKEMTFATVLKSQIYKDRNVLYALEPPTGFLHRTAQKNDLIVELAPILMGSAVNCLFVFGNPGTGKTGLTLDLMNQLKEEAKKQGVELISAYVNCSENRTEPAILLALMSQLDISREYPRMGWTKAKTIAEFSMLLNKIKNNVLIILDEIDYVLKESGDDILYRLSRINNDVDSKVSTILISNDIRVADYLKPRTQSTIGRVKVIFSPYASDELADILRERSRFAFKQDTVADAVISKIAEIEAQRDGDARKALELLDSCAKIAIAKKRSKITLDLVDEADQMLERDHTLNTISTLTEHQKLTYLSILQYEGTIISGTDVFKHYRELCESYNIKPLSERRCRTIVINLTELGLVDSEVGWLEDARKKARKIIINLDDALRNKAIKLIRDSLKEY
ncbi:MAG TPA: AAA family ATPase [Candidatus Nanoarchaeia archaeon]|nr:AAA family ATPase [Candidatus Nanoarchaeia archaeon]